MKTKHFFFIFLVIIYPILLAAQKPVANRPSEIDSLKKVLLTANEDSARVGLRWLIGSKERIYRLPYWDSLLADARKYHLANYECKALISLGSIYNMLNRPDDALNCLSKSLSIAENNGYRADLLPLYSNLATTYGVQSNVGKALDINYKGLKIAEELNDKKFITSFNMSIGTFYLSMGDVEKALKIHLTCLDICREMKANMEIASLLVDIGTDYRELNQPAKAISYYLESGQYVAELGQSHYSAQILNSVGAGYELAGNLDSACWYYTQSYEMSKAIHFSLGMASTQSLLAENSRMRGHFAIAKKQALEALALIRSLKFTKQLPAIAMTLKKIYLHERNYKEALKAYELYISIRDSVSSEKMRKQASDKEFAHAFEKKEQENKLLAQQNQIQTLQLKKNKSLMFGMGATLLLAVAIAYFLIRQGKLNARQQKMQLEQKLLRSQMNPHFIFNSLQAIQNYILNHEAKEAVKYLSAFASLTRNVLENSRVEYIPLKKEIALLENYMQLQKLRFGNRFGYAINVDSQIDTEQAAVPPMLAQPFIENAIKHGMHDIESGGHIEVAYHQHGSTLQMVITDNGYGMQQNVHAGAGHQSLAMEITRERINLMNKNERRKATFHISDAFPTHAGRRGVKISFSLPLQATN